MSYQVLARKWRPKTFAEVIGQTHIITALANGLLLGRVHHAYLLSGTHGVGKTTIARLLAKCLNCIIGISNIPCGKCEHCREIEHGHFIDLIEIDAASRTKVEDTRDILDNVQYSPSKGRFKVYLIDEVHMLSRHSFNALLKTLEEPPKHVKFILATTDPQKLPATILSRCLQFQLKALDVTQILYQLKHVLQSEAIESDPRALQLIAQAANGSMRNALSFTDQAISMGEGVISWDTVSIMLGMVNPEYPLALIEAIINADGNAMMLQISKAALSGINWESLLVEMLSILHRIAMGQLLIDSIKDDDLIIQKRLRKLASVIPPTDLQLYYQTMLVGRKELPYAPNHRMGIEMTLLRALAFHPFTATKPTDYHNGSIEKKKIKAISMHQKSSSPVSDDQIKINNATNMSLKNINQDITTNLSDKYIKFDGKSANNNTISKIKSEELKPLQSYGSFISDDKDKNMIEYSSNIIINNHLDLDHNRISSIGTDRINGTLPIALNQRSQLPITTVQLLRARKDLHQRQELKNNKKNALVPTSEFQKMSIHTLNRFNALAKKHACKQMSSSTNNRKNNARSVEFTVSNRLTKSEHRKLLSETFNTPKIQPISVEKKKSFKITSEIIQELIISNPWAAQVYRLKVPTIVRKLALNSWKEEFSSGKICLHLRSTHKHLNSLVSQQTLAAALSKDLGISVQLTVTIDIDNDLSMKTPLEWSRAIYKKKLLQAREVINKDKNIQALKRSFDADLDEDSIQPVCRYR